MPQIADFQAKSNREMSEIEQQHARMIGCLLACAKNLQTFQKSIALDDGDAGVRCSIALLICLHKMYGGNGSAMERDVLALGKLLGFEVQEMHVGPHTEVSH